MIIDSSRACRPRAPDRPLARLRSSPWIVPSSPARGCLSALLCVVGVAMVVSTAGPRRRAAGARGGARRAVRAARRGAGDAGRPAGRRAGDERARPARRGGAALREGERRGGDRGPDRPRPGRSRRCSRSLRARSARRSTSRSAWWPADALGLTPLVFLVGGALLRAHDAHLRRGQLAAPGARRRVGVRPLRVQRAVELHRRLGDPPRLPDRHGDRRRSSMSHYLAAFWGGAADGPAPRSLIAAAAIALRGVGELPRPLRRALPVRAAAVAASASWSSRGDRGRSAPSQLFDLSLITDSIDLGTRPQLDDLVFADGDRHGGLHRHRGGVRAGRRRAGRARAAAPGGGGRRRWACSCCSWASR